MRLGIAFLASFFFSTLSFAGGDTPASKARDYARKQRQIDELRSGQSEDLAVMRRLQQENYDSWALNVGAPSRSEMAAARPRPALAIDPPPSIPDSQMKALHERIQKREESATQLQSDLAALRTELEATKKSNDAAFEAYNKRLAETVSPAAAAGATPQAKAENEKRQRSQLMIDFKTAKDAMDTMDLLADVKDLEGEAEDIALRSQMMMDRLDSTMMGRYMRQRQKDMLASKTFCDAVKAASNGQSCSDNKAFSGNLVNSTNKDSPNYFDEGSASSLRDQREKSKGSHSGAPKTEGGTPQTRLAPGDGVRVQPKGPMGLPNFPQRPLPAGIAAPVNNSARPVDSTGKGATGLNDGQPR
jgi:uncharacterized protein YhaN